MTLAFCKAIRIYKYSQVLVYMNVYIYIERESNE